MLKPTLRRVLVVVLICSIGLLVGLRLTEAISRIHLSARLTELLRQDLDGLTGFSVFDFFTRKLMNPEFCAVVMSEVDAIAHSSQPRSGYHRLVRFFSLKCETDAEIVARFYRDILDGYVPTAFDNIFIGEALMRTGLPDQAMARWRYTPEISQWYAAKGIYLVEKLKDEQNAWRYFQRAENIDSDFYPTKGSMYLHMCIVYIRDGVTFSNRNPCELLNRVATTATSQVLLGQSYFGQQKYNESRSAFEQAIALDRSLGDAYYWLGRTWLQLDNQAAAMITFRHGVESAAAYPWNYYELARLEAGRGCIDLARQYLQQILNLDAPEAASAAESLLAVLSHRDSNSSQCVP